MLSSEDAVDLNPLTRGSYIKKKEGKNGASCSTKSYRFNIVVTVPFYIQPVLIHIDNFLIYNVFNKIIGGADHHRD